MNNMKTRVRLAVLGMLFSTAVLASAGAGRATAAPTVNPVYQRINSQIASGNAQQTAQAIRTITALLQAGTDYNCPFRLQYDWLPALMNHQDFKAAAHLARVDILANPRLTDNLQQVLAIRVRALLAMGKKKAALRNAKSLFNVCTLADTQAALQLVRESVALMYRKQPWIVQALITQQIAGAKIPADEHEPITRCGVLAAVVVSGRRYEQKLKLLHGSGNWTLLEKGNLELLADHPHRAIKDFRAMAAMAGNAKDFLNDENDICRAIKAEDGTLGRANAHLLSSVKAAVRFP